MEESNRIKRLKVELIKELPFFPNDKETLKELESQDLNDILIHYLHWKTRIIPPRIRSIQVSPAVTTDKRWKLLNSEIKELLNKVSNGDDIYPYHSKSAHKDGYTPASRVRNGEVDSWEDKDQILNTKGFYHFHLNMEVQNSGLSVRTDDVLFAYVTRKTFHAIGIFNHSVFDSADNNGNMNIERARMWELHEKHISFGMEPGAAYITNPIMTSGHTMHLIRMCMYYTDIIKTNDIKLDDRTFVNDLYKQGKLNYPSKFKLEWHFDSLDICLYDKKTKTLFNIHKGHI